MANSPSGESVIARLARLVAAFNPDHSSMSLTVLARRADLPISTTQRLVADLLVHTFLERTQDGLLRLGPLIRESGSSVPAETYVDLRNAAVPMMESVHAVLQQQILLAVLNNDETLYLERVSQDSTATNISQREARLPLLRTPSGLVLLAHQPAGYQETFLARDEGGADDLRTVLSQARIKGYVARPGIITKGTVAVSVPVLGDLHGLPAALTAVIPEADAQIPLTVAVLRAAAYAITAALQSGHSAGLSSRRF
jgi:DNA-binding IclR family transcriptional regulator